MIINVTSMVTNRIYPAVDLLNEINVVCNRKNRAFTNRLLVFQLEYCDVRYS